MRSNTSGSMCRHRLQCHQVGFLMGNISCNFFKSTLQLLSNINFCANFGPQFNFFIIFTSPTPEPQFINWNVQKWPLVNGRMSRDAGRERDLRQCLLVETFPGGFLRGNPNANRDPSVNLWDLVWDYLFEPGNIKGSKGLKITKLPFSSISPKQTPIPIAQNWILRPRSAPNNRLNFGTSSFTWGHSISVQQRQFAKEKRKR